MTARPSDARGPDSRRLTGAVLALALCAFVSIAASGGVAALALVHFAEPHSGGAAGTALSTSTALPTRSGPSDASFPSGALSPAAARPSASTGTNASVANATTITNVAYGGSGAVTVENGTQYVWRSEPTAVTVDYRIGGNATSFVVSQAACLDFRKPDGNESRYACVDGNNSRRTQSATFSLKQWPSNEAGPYTHPTVSVETSGVTDRSVLANRTLAAVSIAKGGDLDGDGLSNAAEVSHGTSLTNPDTDSDTLSDGAEVHTYHTDPTRKDTDADGLSDPRELSLNTNPTNPDTDGDGLNDGAEVAFGSDPTNPDTDGDGLNDSVEHAIGTNPRNVDTDGDGLSDASEYHVGLNPTSPLDVEVLGLLVVLLPAAAVVVLLRRDRLSVPAWLADAADDAVDGLGGPARADGDRPTGALADPEPDPEPTTDRDRVVRLVEDAGGRIKQSRIVEETGWSKAKVSRLLSSMADQGEITKVRIGRENLICVEEEAPSRRRD